jgi:hypothetical protein
MPIFLKNNEGYRNRVPFKKKIFINKKTAWVSHPRLICFVLGVFSRTVFTFSIPFGLIFHPLNSFSKRPPGAQRVNNPFC